MTIEVHRYGKKVKRFPVDLEIEEFTKIGYLYRKERIERIVARIRKVYPYADIWLVFESKMNTVEID